PVRPGVFDLGLNNDKTAHGDPRMFDRHYAVWPDLVPEGRGISAPDRARRRNDGRTCARHPGPQYWHDRPPKPAYDAATLRRLARPGAGTSRNSGTRSGPTA